jgi:alpha-L-arabinofuranosidase
MNPLRRAWTQRALIWTKRTIYGALFQVLVFAAACFIAECVWATTATVTIDAGKSGPKLNPRMYGIFLEEINHGVDGGLYAELIRNRGFEDAKPPEGFLFKNGRWVDSDGRGAYDAGFARFGYFTNGLPFWSLVREGGAQGSMRLDTENPLSPATPRSLRLEIENVSGGRLGISNEGFWGMGLQSGHEYNLSFWARAADGFAGSLSATLVTADGAVCCQPAGVKGLTGAWKQFHARLRATGDEAAAKFVLTAAAKGTVWLDLVSLFPAATFKSHPNGLRADLAQMLADLKPGFVRFPGGCVVEGGTVETAYNWKNTVGPLEQREEVWGPWNYRRTSGMGFHEYLQFGEDIGAEPLYVGFAGETCMFRHAEDVPMEQMGWVVTNFLDAIEYANGSSSSAWGKLRAQQGHAKPFGLKMVEVGNENGTRNFPERYRLVHSALKKQYPDIQYVADFSFPRFMGEETSDIQDNHFYNSPQWFLNNVHHYDTRDRKLPPVYDGEVAVTSGEGGRDKGNLIAALSEGAFLMGLERNADVVRMVSYAPLLAHVRGRTDWHGMIYFDSTRSYGTVSYYLWKLFGLNRPACSLQTDVQLPATEPKSIGGSIGLGTWNTAAEFKDIRVEKAGQVLYTSDFARGAENWKAESGNWSVVEGAYRQSDSIIGLSYFGDESWTDYTLSLKARKLKGAEGFLVAFGHKGQDKYWWNVGGWGNTEHAIEFNQNPVGPHVAGSVETDRWYELKVELSGTRIRCYLDGKLVHDETARTPEQFFALAGRDDSGHHLLLKVINAGAEPVNAQLQFQNAGRISREAELTLLTSSKPTDNNSLENPTAVRPVTSQIQFDPANCVREFPPYSFSLLRLETN